MAPGVRCRRQRARPPPGAVRAHRAVRRRDGDAQPAERASDEDGRRLQPADARVLGRAQPERRRRPEEAARGRRSPAAQGQQDADGGCNMATAETTTTPYSPAELAKRVQRDMERNLLRVRNGIKLASGIGQAQARPDAEGHRVDLRQDGALALQERPAPVPAAGADGDEPGQPQLHLRPAAGQQPRRVHAQPRVRRVRARLGRPRPPRRREHPVHLHRRLPATGRRRRAARRATPTASR